jgi:hypothetical protein
MPRNTAAAAQKRFKALIAEFLEGAAKTLDEEEKRLVERIAENPEAPSVLGATEDEKTGKRLLSLCIEAHSVLTNFHRMIAEARRVLKKEPIYKHAIATFEQLLKETQEARLERLTAKRLWVCPPRQREI